MTDEKNFEILRRLLISDRSVRRYEESFSVDAGVLERLVELTRYCASGRNMQPLRYRMVCDAAERERVFPLLAWAGYMPDWDGPAEGERPAAYLVQCLDTRYGEALLCDDGLQLQAITLGAAALGLGCCIIKSFNSVKLKEELSLPEGMKPLYVLAIGRPAETVVIEETDGTPDADIKYYRAADGVHHVPKRPLGELIIEQ